MGTERCSEGVIWHFPYKGMKHVRWLSRTSACDVLDVPRTTNICRMDRSSFLFSYDMKLIMLLPMWASLFSLRESHRSNGSHFRLGELIWFYTDQPKQASF